MAVNIQNEGTQITDIHNPVQNKTGGKRPNTSFYHLTVNTNKRYNYGSLQLDQESQKLKDASDGIFSNIKDYIKITKSGDSWDKNTINRVALKGAVERGDTNDQVHCHMMIFIWHYTLTKLDLAKIKQHFKNVLGLDNVYLFLRMHKSGGEGYSNDPEEALKNYLNKNVKSP